LGPRISCACPPFSFFFFLGSSPPHMCPLRLFLSPFYDNPTNFFGFSFSLPLILFFQLDSRAAPPTKIFFFPPPFSSPLIVIVACSDPIQPLFFLLWHVILVVPFFSVSPKGSVDTIVSGLGPGYDMWGLLSPLDPPANASDTPFPPNLFFSPPPSLSFPPQCFFCRMLF